MFGEIKDIVALFKTSPVTIDNNVFKLHYKLAVIMLLVFSVFLSVRQFFGDPIDCIPGGENYGDFLDTYCWFNSYVRIRAEDKVSCLQLEKFPKNVPRCDYDKKESYIYVPLTYYQWIGICLLVQTAMFYLPRYIWRYIWEEGRVKELVCGMKHHVVSQEIQKKEEIIIQYIQEHQGQHTSYFIKFILCECLNFINVVGQIFITDWFLGNAFLNFGVEKVFEDVYETHEDDQTLNQLLKRDRFFPKETECTIHTGSISAGSVNAKTFKCVLPHQVFNEKIYIFLWFFFVLLSIITGLFLVFRVATILSPKLRMYLLNKEAILLGNDALTKKIAYNYSIGDWFIIYQIGKNVNPYVFGDILKNIKRKSIGHYDEEKQEKFLLNN